MITAQSKHCETCGKGFLKANHPEARFCSRTCAQKRLAPLRKGSKGFIVSAKGYIQLRRPNHPMASREGYVMAHRLAMAEHLGRLLTAQEVVHHLNGDKADNRVENLEVLAKRIHDRLPKPPIKPIQCPHCGKTIKVSGRVRKVAK